MALRLFEKRYATATMTTSPSSPVKRCMAYWVSAHDFENQGALFRHRGGDAESAFHELRGLFHQVLARVVQAAQHAARIHFLPDLDLQDHAHRRIDGVVLILAARADHGGSLADSFGVDGADVAGAWRIDLARSGSVGQQFETVHHAGVAALRRDDLFEFSV